MWEALETVRKVVEKSRLVQIDMQALVRFSRKLLTQEIKLPA